MDLNRKWPSLRPNLRYNRNPPQVCERGSTYKSQFRTVAHICIKPNDQQDSFVEQAGASPVR